MKNRFLSIAFFVLILAACGDTFITTNSLQSTDDASCGALCDASSQKVNSDSNIEIPDVNQKDTNTPSDSENDRDALAVDSSVQDSMNVSDTSIVDAGFDGFDGFDCVPESLVVTCGRNSCGPVVNNCGVSVSCGACPSWAVCASVNSAPQACICTSPVPNPCAGLQCGEVTNCGSTFNCGSCPATQRCGFATANKCDGCTRTEEFDIRCRTSGIGKPNAYLCVGFVPPIANCANVPGINVWCCDL